MSTESKPSVDAPASRDRGRKRTVLAIVAAVLVVVVVVGLVAGRKTIPERALGLLDSPLRGERVLSPGGHLVLPAVEHLTILDPLDREATGSWSSPEGAQLEFRYRVRIQLTEEGAKSLAGRGEGPSLAARIDSALDGIVESSIERAPRDGSLPRLDEQVLTSLAAELAEFGTVEGRPSIELAEESPVVLALRREQAIHEVREMSRDTGVRILIVGLDGADWQIADPLIERGLLPNLASLKSRGSWSNIKALSPILSPLIWTSIATGVTPDRHGILDFLVIDPRTGSKVPVNSRFRKVRALWNIFTEADRSVDFVAWWATWPAEEIDGFMVSDRVSYSLFDFSLPSGGAGATYPASYFEEIRPRLVGDDGISYEEVARFADVGREEFLAERALIERDRKEAYKRPLNHLTKILAATLSYHRIALDLLARQQPELMAVYYQGIDEVGHRFMHFAPPRMTGVSEEDYRRFKNVVERFYVYQDELLGELLRAVSPDTTVIVLSDHGFVNGPDRPQGQTADIEGQPARWHRRYGMLVLAGPPIAPGRLDTTSMLDITPTVLRLAGLPVADDMDGAVLEEAIRPEFRKKFPVTRIATYERVPLGLDAAPMTEEMAAVEAEVLENLRALGYIGGGGSSDLPAADAGGPDDGPLNASNPEDAPPTLTAHTNLAGILLAEGELERAEKEILAALEQAPRFVTARRQLFDLRVRQKRYDEAIRVARQLIEDGAVSDPRFLGRLAEAYRRAGRGAEGIAAFRSAVRAGQWELGVPLARLLLDEGDLAGADAAAREVLTRDPLNEVAMATVVRIAQSSGHLPEIRPLLEAALEANPRSVMHLNWMAVLDESVGEVQRAEDLLRRALEIDPDHGGAQANLGAFYGRHGRAAEAVPLLRRALRIDPGNRDARVNLGTALARMGKMDEAIEEFETAVERGSRDVGVYNALARAYWERGDPASAADWLRRSLEIDPHQDQIRQLLDSIEKR